MRARTPATIAARLTYRGVTHRYGATPAVSDFSLDIAPGEIVSLVGPSGCGKTTLLRLAAGVERPSAGSILINEREVAGGSFEPPERRGVGLMFQDFALFPHLSNLANVMFGLKWLPNAEAEREARAALDRVGLAKYAELYPHMLSGGEQQRVALARAVAPRPSVLLMDEPFSGLDRRLRDQVREEILHVLRESRVTCVIVTHDAEEAMLLADRIALMRAGRLVQEGEPRALYREPGRPVRGAAVLRVERDTGRSCMTASRCRRRAASRRRPCRKAAPRSWRSARRAFRCVRPARGLPAGSNPAVSSARWSKFR